MTESRLTTYFVPTITRGFECGRSGGLLPEEALELVKIAQAQDRVIRHLASELAKARSNNYRRYDGE